ncbi:MAG: NAD(P)H-dependent glycerol-3-phosphate dehydrogenase [Lachnospiraceae bacterium]|nr:NAD(P)H-dependent glycerol-3-phosphate dehydrogenase [Lachnospiraceae bacterium]
MENCKIGILGAGSWGTALALVLAKKGHNVDLWSAVKTEVELLRTKREHVDRLPGAILPDNINIEESLELACKDKDLIVFAVASPFVRTTAHNAKEFIKDGQRIVNVSKGIEDNTFKTLLEIIEEEIPQAKCCVLCGPSHAEEVSKDIPTTCVAGAKSRELAEFVQDIFICDTFRVYTSPDVIGMELGASLKNVIALAAGIVDGLGFGDNTKAALITRGIAEITRLGCAMGAQPETFAGLSGIGDLIVTCTSIHSRNRQAGFLIGKGYKLADAINEVNQTVEGVNTAKAAYGLAKKYNVEMPIVEQICKVLFEDKSAKVAIYDLLRRDKSIEYKTLKWND